MELQRNGSKYDADARTPNRSRKLTVIITAWKWVNFAIIYSYFCSAEIACRVSICIGWARSVFIWYIWRLCITEVLLHARRSAKRRKVSISIKNNKCQPEKPVNIVLLPVKRCWCPHVVYSHWGFRRVQLFWRCRRDRNQGCCSCSIYTFKVYIGEVLCVKCCDRILNER